MTQTNLFSEPPSQPFARGSHTSFKAAKQVNAEHRKTITAQYLAALARYESLSDEEAFVLLLRTLAPVKIARSSMSSIRAACITAGLVEKGGRVAKSSLDRDVATWMLTAKGRKAQG